MSIETGLDYMRSPVQIYVGICKCTWTYKGAKALQKLIYLDVREEDSLASLIPSLHCQLFSDMLQKMDLVKQYLEAENLSVFLPFRPM